MKKRIVSLSVLLMLLLPYGVSAQNLATSESNSEKIEASSVKESKEQLEKESLTTISSEMEIIESESEYMNSSSDQLTEKKSSTKKDTVADEDNSIKIENVENKYVTVINPSESIWEEIDKKNIGTTSTLINQTVSVREIVTTKDGRVYFLLYDKESKKIGYVLKSAVSEASGAQGIFKKVNVFLTLKRQDVNLYQNFDWQLKSKKATIFSETLQARGVYQHFNGKIYYSLYDGQGNWQGYVDSIDVTVAEGKQGTWKKADKYVRISKNNYTIWQNFNWIKKNNTSNLMDKTLQVRGYYNHFNGSVYYSLFDGQGKWQGYVNKNAVTETKNKQGDWIKTSKYVTISNKNYKTYSNFNWQVRQSTSSLMNQTFKATGRYEHFNGSTYYSLYDKNDKWYGYVNKNAVKEGVGSQGAFIVSKDFVTVTNGNYDVWQNFSWKKKKSSKSLLNKTYQVKGYYKHINGGTYYSLYDNKGNWQGYLNANAAKVAPGKQGIWFGMNKRGTIYKSGYTVWNDFNWTKKGTTNSMMNKKYQIKGYYNHFNGDTYYSLYDGNGKWQGYLNSNAVRFKRTVADFLGTTPDRVVGKLKSHESDGFYVGTPYKSIQDHYDPAYLMSPNGRPNKYGPGMNCTGFVAYAYQDGGANLGKITQSANAWRGIVNAYNWRDALTKNTDYETFYSVNQLLSSGKAKKGDILYFEPDFTKPNPDPHLGIFWGNSSNQNSFFHTTWPSTKISEIYSYTPYSKIYLFSL